jgi:hypothetical protein
VRVVPPGLSELLVHWINCHMSTSRVAAFSSPLRLMAATAFAAVPFDGVWAVTLTCPSTDDGVYGYVLRFDAQVTDSVLHGGRGSRDTGGWMTLDGASTTQAMPASKRAD